MNALLINQANAGLTLSVVVPVLDEQDNVASLVGEIAVGVSWLIERSQRTAVEEV